jgi:hypothetical protein
MSEQEGEGDFQVIRGAEAIARAIGTSRRRAYFLCEAGLLPVQKEGAQWVTTRRKLDQHYNGDAA